MLGGPLFYEKHFDQSKHSFYLLLYHGSFADFTLSSFPIL